MSLRSLMIAGAILLAPAAMSALDAAAEPRKPKYDAKLSIDEARALALREVPGTVVDEELERERGVWVYEFEIRPDGNGRKKEVLINADTGAVVANNDDDDDDDDDDDGDDDDDDDDDD